jgi:hypothetical protein
MERGLPLWEHVVIARNCENFRSVHSDCNSFGSGNIRRLIVAVSEGDISPFTVVGFLCRHGRCVVEARCNRAARRDPELDLSALNFTLTPVTVLGIVVLNAVPEFRIDAEDRPIISTTLHPGREYCTWVG